MNKFATSYYAHFVPQAYLKNFVPQGGRVAIFEKHKPREKLLIKLQPISSICGKENFFHIDGLEQALKDPKFELKVKKKKLKVRPTMLEEELSKYETEISRILSSIIQHKSFDALQRDDLSFLIQWIAWLHIAHPITKSILQEKDPEGSSASEALSFMDWHKKLLPFFKAKNWGVQVTIEHEFLKFLTSDRPVIIERHSQSPFDLHTIEKSIIFFPISPEILLIGFPNNDRSLHFSIPKEVTLAHIYDLNYRMYQNASELLIANNRKTLENLLKIIEINRLIFTLKKYSSQANDL